MVLVCTALLFPNIDKYKVVKHIRQAKSITVSKCRKHSYCESVNEYSYIIATSLDTFRCGLYLHCAYYSIKLRSFLDLVSCVLAL